MPQDMSFLDDYLVRPDPQAARLGATVSGIDQTGATVETRVVTERALTLYLNAQEIVTMMTIGDHPDALALGFAMIELQPATIRAQWPFGEPTGSVATRNTQDEELTDERHWPAGGHAGLRRVTVGRLEPDEQVAAGGSSGPRDGAPPAAPQTTRTLGLGLSPLTPELRETFSIGPDTQGVVITEVEGDSAASSRGIDAGDVIVEAGQQPVGDPAQVQERVDEAKREGRRSVLMLIDRQGELRYVPVPVEGGPG